MNKKLNKVKIRKLMQEIAKENNLTISYDEVNNLVNCSCLFGREVIIGKYKDIELEFISFFHELAHCMFEADMIRRLKFSRMQNELYVTSYALQYAEIKYNIIFSGKAIKWMIKQGLTYFGWEEREIRK